MLFKMYVPQNVVPYANVKSNNFKYILNNNNKKVLIFCDNNLLYMNKLNKL